MKKSEQYKHRAAESDNDLAAMGYDKLALREERSKNTWVKPGLKFLIKKYKLHV